MNTPLVEMRNIFKSFGGTNAVEDVSVSVSPGEVLGIVGHNGAGKVRFSLKERRSL
jgi:D-xylose transport system ATP-binding protein